MLTESALTTAQATPCGSYLHIAASVNVGSGTCVVMVTGDDKRLGLQVVLTIVFTAVTKTHSSPNQSLV